MSGLGEGFAEPSRKCLGKRKHEAQPYDLPVVLQTFSEVTEALQGQDVSS